MTDQQSDIASGATKKAPEDDEYVTVRTELAQVLAPSAFPGDKHRLREVAEENGAASEMVRLFDKLPEDRVFHTPQEIIEAMPTHRPN